MRNSHIENMSRLSVVFLSSQLDLLRPDKAALIFTPPPMIISMGKQKEYKTINAIYLLRKTRQPMKLLDLGVMFFDYLVSKSH